MQSELGETMLQGIRKAIEENIILQSQVAELEEEVKVNSLMKEEFDEMVATLQGWAGDPQGFLESVVSDRPDIEIKPYSARCYRVRSSVSKRWRHISDIAEPEKARMASPRRMPTRMRKRVPAVGDASTRKKIKK